MNDDDILLLIEIDSRLRTERVKAVLLGQGRPDLVEELERNLRDVRLGLSSARGIWHALSAAQRRVMEALGEGRWLVREQGSKTQYDAHGETGAIARICRLPTARNLIARELLACEGGAFDPERRLVLTEHGRFVLKHCGAAVITSRRMAG